MVLVGDFNIAMSSKDVHPSIQFQGLYTVEELTIMKVTDLREHRVTIMKVT